MTNQHGYAQATVNDIAGALLTRADLQQAGTTEREIAQQVSNGTLIRVRHGWYLPAAISAAWRPEDRHLAHVLAVARDASSLGVVFSHTSAAVLWGLPLYKVIAPRVHMTVNPNSRNSTTRDVVRHASQVDKSDADERHGIRVTSLRRTVFDTARSLSLEAGVSIADAAERLISFDGWEWNDDARERWRRGLQDLIDSNPGARGIRRARTVASFANGRAQLPLESVSRLQLSRLGFAPPRLQVPVPDPQCGHYWMDLAMDELRTFVEIDGAAKYFDADLRRGLTMEQVIWNEKQREDWVRGMTSYRVVRWGGEHCATPKLLRDRLMSFGIRSPR